ncbi:3 beta-hydroxysteroid dehydrogenase/Delta 5--_4-isomerase [Planctomycetes bacterium Pan216]|uniref:3 beta-hydroxysteroid dehydrogenase/Delta 5-->4-isomerase n=1 Tax=Kolteria novifilia TaxID=2527975 RepID=A0A518B9Q4_9BACT|nr:3 beta-hydroxysteroid dehydrogenase/Delta 5-->4-isomerase [Planctomycetes bacterium Pan216]
MKVLVTGGGGFLGRALVNKLLRRGDEVRVFARGDYPDLVRDGAELVRGDLADPAVVADACQEREVVFHVAALAGIWGPRTSFERTNILGTENVLAGCQQHGVERLVYTSSPSVVFPKGKVDIAGWNESAPYPERFGCAYSRTKAIAEEKVLRAGRDNRLRAASLRPHLIWGPGDAHLIPRVVSRAKEGNLVRVGSGTNRVDLTYVDNAADAHLLAADALDSNPDVAGKAYFISDGAPVELWTWINDLLTRLDVPPVRRAISYRTAATIGGVMEAVYATLRLRQEPRMTRFLASQLSGDHYFSIENARRDLGYEPAVDNETGMKQLVDWLRETSAS